VEQRGLQGRKQKKGGEVSERKKKNRLKRTNKGLRALTNVMVGARDRGRRASGGGGF